MKLDGTEHVFATTRFTTVDGKGITKQSDLGCLMWFGIEVAFVVKGKVARGELSFSC